MIDVINYLPEDVDKIYSAVEEAATNNSPIDMWKIKDIVKAGDFCWIGPVSGKCLFVFQGLKWVWNGGIYTCYIEPQNWYGHILPVWVPVITVNERDGSSWGRLNMIRKEFRINNTFLESFFRSLS